MTERSGVPIGAVTGSNLDAAAGASVEPTPEDRRAAFRVVRGGPSDEELAALTVVLAAATSGGEPTTAAAEPDRWSAPAATHRVPLSPGRGAWRTTYWPR